MRAPKLEPYKYVIDGIDASDHLAAGATGAAAASGAGVDVAVVGQNLGNGRQNHLLRYIGKPPLDVNINAYFLQPIGRCARVAARWQGRPPSVRLLLSTPI